MIMSATSRQLRRCWYSYGPFSKTRQNRSAAYAKAAMAAKALEVQNDKSKKIIAKKVKKACRTRWLSTDLAIRGVFEDFVALTQTLRLYKELENNSTAIGLLNQIGNIKFLSVVYLLHEVLPALSHLSKAFQRGTVSFSAIQPAIDYTIDQLTEIAAEKKPLRKLQKDLGEGGRLITTEIFLTPTAESYLENLTVKYTDSLKDNINNRFSDTLPVLSAFKIFNPSAVPNRSDQSFKDYGVEEIKILATHFYQETVDAEEKADELECEWNKFKYNLLQLKNEIPQHILHPPKNRNLVVTTPTEWALNQMLSQRTTYEHFMPLLIQIAEVCLSLPVSNAWPERGASAVKRLKTRLRSTLKNDMLDALMQISINGPEIDECASLIEDTVKKWLPKRKKLAKTKKNLVANDTPASAPVVRVDSLSAEEAREVSVSNMNASLEIDSIVAALNLPKQEDASDSDSSIEASWESDSEL